MKNKLCIEIKYMISIELTVTIVGMVIAIFAFIPLYLDYFQRRKVYMDNIIISGFYEHPNDHVDKDLRISVRNLNNIPIYFDKVMYNKYQLPWAYEKETLSKKIIDPGGAINVLFPKGIQIKSEEEIKVQNGKKILKKIKFKDLPIK